MEILWSDGVTSALHHRTLRGFCPCATCQGHQGPIRFLDPEKMAAVNLELKTIEETGRYALRLGWGDGHETGIYTFRYLRTLGDRSDALGEKMSSERFER